MKQLSFKGDSKATKKTRKTKQTQEIIAKIHVHEPESTNKQWVSAYKSKDLNGPLLFCTTIIQPFAILNSVAGLGRVSFKPPPHVDLPDLDGVTIQELEPWVASQVFVCNTMPSRTKITFKDAFGKYMTADKFGVVGCEMEAAGEAEAWELIEVESGGFAFKTFWGGFLTVEADGNLRADGAEIGITNIDLSGPNETFHIKCQFQNRLTTLKPEIILTADTEVAQLKKFYSFGGNMAKYLTHDHESLDRARKEGTLNAELLERRSLLKGDKFCK